MALRESFGKRSAKHGTNSGYVSGCRKECCVQAHRLAAREYRSGQRRERTYKHGTWYAYWDKECRCASCRGWYRGYLDSLKAQRTMAKETPKAIAIHTDSERYAKICKIADEFGVSLVGAARLLISTQPQ